MCFLQIDADSQFNSASCHDTAFIFSMAATNFLFNLVCNLSTEIYLSSHYDLAVLQLTIQQTECFIKFIN